MPNRAAFVSALAVLVPSVVVLVATAVLARSSASAPATGSVSPPQSDGGQSVAGASHPAASKPAPAPRPSGPIAPDFEGGGTWINSEPLKLADLTGKGKVILVDFWTYGCYNCQNTLPYVKQWWEKYK